MTIRKQSVIGVIIAAGLLGSSAAFAQQGNPGTNAGNGQAPVAASSAANAPAAPRADASAAAQAVEAAPTIPYVAAAVRTGAADIQLRSTSPALDAALSSKTTDAPEPIASPAIIYIERARNSAATQYVYAITRDGQVAVSSDKPLSIIQSRILLRHRTEEVAGLRSGAVTLWVWGVDQFGHISSPAKAKFIIAGQD